MTAAKKKAPKKQPGKGVSATRARARSESPRVVVPQAVGARQFFGCELSPAFVDVVVKRWQDHTGESAVLASDGAGLTFAEVEATRGRVSKR